MSFYPQKILLRLRFISDQLNYLKDYENISFTDYTQDLEKRLTIERLLELTIQAAIDINRHIITKSLGLEFPKESKQSFIVLGQHQILTKDLAKKLTKSAGLRNILAHEYLEIDNTIVYESIPKALTQYPLYIQQITTYLDSLE